MRASAYLTPENAAAKVREWEELLSALPRPGRRLRPSAERCALIVVDMMRFFLHPGGGSYIPSSRAAAANAARLVEAWRKAGGVVVFTRHCHEPGEEEGSLKRFFGKVIRCGDPDSEPLPPFLPAEGETLLRKHTYDAFHGTGLEEALRERGAEQVAVCGVLANMCCETTARSAFVRGFDVFFPMDAVAAAFEEHHEAALVNLAAGFARVLSADELIREAGFA